jgi:endonuclease G
MKKVILLISALIVGSSIFIYTLMASPTVSVSDPEIESVPVSDTCMYIFMENLEFPETNPKDEIISHTGYSFLYNEDHEQSSWVAYLLTTERTKAVVKRKDHFRTDPAVKTKTATNDDYLKTGYDKGHLAPCADMCWSFVTMDESFFFSNMSPQAPSFNRGIWENLEELVRDWAIEYDTLYIVTGPVLRDGLPVIGKKNKVSVPEYYYKVVLNYTSGEIKGIGFIMPNEKSNQPLQDFAVTIDSVQKFTGINFFHQLSEAQQECAEKTLCIPCWSW